MKPPSEVDPAGARVTREAVLAVVRNHPGAAGKREIARELGLNAVEKLELKALLHAMEAEGALERVGRRAFAAPDATPKVAVVAFTDVDDDGDLIGRLAGREADETGPRVRLPAREADGRKPGAPPIGVGDRALCRLAPDEDEGLVARLIKVLPRQGRRSMGVVRTSGGSARIEPLSKAAKGALALNRRDGEAFEDGDLVVFGVDVERRGGRKTARIVERVGRADGPHAPTLMAIAEHEIPIGFSDAELAEARSVEPASPKGRENLTKLPLITIDPEDARDHDDAVFAEPDDDAKNPGGFVVWVAIADVAAYVRPNSALDRGAERRGNSVYFPDRVVPMLPERLSNDLCSLREGEPRPCLAVRMVFDRDGNKRGHRFVRAFMRSAAKLAYGEAQAAIDGTPSEKTGPLLDPVLRPLWAAYAAMSAARDRRSPLDIDAPERRVKLDAEGRVLDVVKRERFDAHRLIEECMIQANVCAAESLEAKRQVLIYRVHDEPSREKIEALAEFLPEVGLRWTKGEVATPKRFNRLLKAASGGDHAEVVNEMVLRSQAQAVYSPENLGHFGLNLQKYAHFTSPIRRYADLVVHRALIRAHGWGDDGLSDDQADRLVTIAERISSAERKAMAAERDATDRYLAQFLAEREGESFEGRIAGVTRAGCFVKLKATGADGLAPISRLGTERFIHDARAHALISERDGGRYRLGQTVTVRLIEATPVSGGLLFDILTPPEPGPRPSARLRRGDDRARARPKGRRKR